MDFFFANLAKDTRINTNIDKVCARRTTPSFLEANKTTHGGIKTSAATATVAVIFANQLKNERYDSNKII